MRCYQVNLHLNSEKSLVLNNLNNNARDDNTMWSHTRMAVTRESLIVDKFELQLPIEKHKSLEIRFKARIKPCRQPRLGPSSTQTWNDQIISAGLMNSPSICSKQIRLLVYWHEVKKGITQNKLTGIRMMCRGWHGSSKICVVLCLLCKLWVFLRNMDHSIQWWCIHYFLPLHK